MLVENRERKEEGDKEEIEALKKELLKAYQ